MNFGSLVQFIHMPHGAVTYKNSWMSYVGEHQVKMLPTAHRAFVVSEKSGVWTSSSQCLCGIITFHHIAIAQSVLHCRACVVILCFSLFFQKLFKVKAIPKDEEALVDDSAEGAKMDAMVNEPQGEIEMIEEGSNGPQTKESLVGEGNDDGEKGDDHGEQGDDDGERPLRLGDLEKVWVPMRMDGTNKFVACCG